MSGRSLTEHITELITKSLSESDNLNLDINSSIKIKNLEERLLTIESIVSNREYVSRKLKPFTNWKQSIEQNSSEVFLIKK